MTTLTEKTAIVTGASRGIGRAIALELARRGANVVVNYQSRAEAAQEVVDQIRSTDGQAVMFQADVSVSDQAAALVKAAQQAYGRVDILVNNAGTTRDTLLMTMKEEDWDQVLDTNLKSVFNTCKAVSRSMIRQRSGRIINITSVVALTGQGGQTNYAASKAGMIGFTKSLAKELGSRNITVNAVAPGFIPTALTDVLTDEQKQKILQMIALGRFGQPEEIAYAVAFLASDEAAYITGQTLIVDGGMV